MNRRHPSSTRTDTLIPNTTVVRAVGLETHDGRRELGRPRVEPQRAAAADDRGRDREAYERRADEKQLLAMPLTRAARRRAVGEDEPARNHPVNKNARAISGRRRRYRRQPGVEQQQKQPRIAAEREPTREQIVQPANLAARSE